MYILNKEINKLAYLNLIKTLLNMIFFILQCFLYIIYEIILVYMSNKITKYKTHNEIWTIQRDMN